MSNCFRCSISLSLSAITPAVALPYIEAALPSPTTDWLS
nr:MAG TPA: hypothetical protein [Caudoviricetes sp.]